MTGGSTRIPAAVSAERDTEFHAQADSDPGRHAKHNLKNIDLDLPRGLLTVICGPSGSGKSSLALDTLFAAGQRRYVEALSTYARQFLERLEKPDVDRIDGTPPGGGD